MSEIKHILVIRLSAMGDVAISVPVLQAFVKQNPQIKVTVLTRKFFTPFFRDISNVSVFNADLKGKHKGVLGLYRLSKELKRLGINQVADLHSVLRTQVLKFFFFGKFFVQINKGRKHKKALIEGAFFKPLKSSHERYADVFRRLGYVLNLETSIIQNPQTLPNKFVQLFSQNLKPLIGIAPFAQYTSKMYPLDKMKEVVKRLSQDYNIILFGGGHQEKKQLEVFESTFSNVYSIIGKYSFSEELAIISNLEMMLSMDSGNGHLAAMFGVKVVTIWGNTHPYAGFTPFMQPESHQLIPNKKNHPLLPTSIYGNKVPQNYINVAGTITPEKIVTTIKTILKI